MSQLSKSSGSMDRYWETESPLPATRPLTLTRNFVWVVLFCLATLQIVPVLIAWLASAFLK